MPPSTIQRPYADIAIDTLYTLYLGKILYAVSKKASTISRFLDAKIHMTAMLQTHHTVISRLRKREVVAEIDSKVRLQRTVSVLYPVYTK